jgi:hypothetical protein
MGGESGDFVAHTLGGGDGDFINDTFVGVKIEGETGVVLLDDGTCGFLDGFGADSLFGKQTNSGVSTRVLWSLLTREAVRIGQKVAHIVG